MRLSTLIPAILAATLSWGALPVQAQGSYPNKPVRMIVPFPAGQATDMVARMLAEGLGRVWGQQVVVENRPGVPGMMVGKEALPDGYTITFGTSGTLAVNPAVIAKITYDTQRDYAMIHGGSHHPDGDCGQCLLTFHESQGPGRGRAQGARQVQHRVWRCEQHPAPDR